MVDPSGAANWFSFGDTADAQRQEARAAMEAEYRYVYRKNPESLVGKSDDDIQKMLAGNIQARKLELDVGGKPRHVYMPPGTSLQTMMGGYKGNSEQYTAALQSVIQSAVDAAVDPSKVERVIIQAGTAGAQGQNLTATVLDKSGIMHNLSINNAQVQQLAQEGYDAALAGQIKVGEQNIATRPATFYDHDAGRTAQMNVNGSNSAGIEPELFSDIMVNMMQFEGYRGTKGNGSVGFGLHDNSGFPVPKQLSPQWAADVLKTSLEKQYIPNVKTNLKDSGLSATTEAMKVLVDLNYHGGNGSSEPVAQAVAKVKAAYGGGAGTYQYPVATAEAEAWKTLRDQPAYKQAQDSRKRYLEQNMRSWMYSLRF
jgi:dUTPase